MATITWKNEPTPSELLEQAKQEKLKELNSKYSEELTSGFTSNGIKFKYQEIDQLNFTKRTNAVALGTSDPSFFFGTADGVFEFTIEQWKVAAKDAEIHEMTVYQKLDTLRNQVYNVTSTETFKEQLDGVVW